MGKCALIKSLSIEIILWFFLYTLRERKGHGFFFIGNQSEDTGSYQTEWSYVDDEDFDQNENSSPLEEKSNAPNDNPDYNIEPGAPPKNHVPGKKSGSPIGNRFGPGYA